MDRQSKQPKGSGLSAKQQHRYVKHYGCDCGDPRCYACAKSSHRYFNEPQWFDEDNL